jgi:hypothetical protein
MRLQLLCRDVVNVEARAAVRAELEFIGRPSVEVLRKEALKVYAIAPRFRPLQLRLSALLDSPQECNHSPELKLLVGVERLSCPENWHRPVVSFEAHRLTYGRLQARRRLFHPSPETPVRLADSATRISVDD